jgi:putative peptidoglycan lipid II flippase
MVHFLLAPITVDTIVLREPLVRIVYQRGALNEIATQETAWVLLFLSMEMAILVAEYGEPCVFCSAGYQDADGVGLVTVGINVELDLLLGVPRSTEGSH